ncbi:YheC/YheD family protein [Paenibacillus thermotolerans]|uniref:YheC/YheD family endospore coat-associated protein n=1 Tax=Paenibacillus thermotolerans TaxID=3027807 RepID=UPI002368BD3D|nr:MULTISPECIES: YheC/YheD family protein [unclassified Paenibacillus]
MKPVIGILAYRKGGTFTNSQFLSDLIHEGNKLGAIVYAFSYLDIIEDARKIRGFVRSANGKWHGKLCPWPDIVIDFCRVLIKPFRDMRRRTDLFEYANHKFTYKWKAMKLFTASEAVKKWIPETYVYTPSHVSGMLEKHPIVYVKPGNGTGGRSVVKIRRLPAGYLFQGRAKSGKIVTAKCKSKEAVLHRLSQWVQSEQIRTGNFIVQQGLDLELLPGRSIDARILVQKDGNGEWGVTGKVLRVSAKNSPTTNILHADGYVLRFKDFMTRRFGAKKAKEIEQECNRLSFRLMEVIEQRFGSMIEFGLDVGVDTKGDVWLIEANPKPGHKVFIKSKEAALYLESLRKPIQYAKYLIRTRGLQR